MDANGKTSKTGITRRGALKFSGAFLGGLAVNNGGCFCPNDDGGNCTPSDDPTQRYSYFENLTSFNPWDPNDPNTTPLAAHEMRITFLGSQIPPVRRAQQMMSVFVEVGPWIYDPASPGDPTKGRATDQFVFDCGSGVCANYGAMGIGFGRMDKIFLTHLHGDHMSDLTHIYCFGPSADRKSPLYVWGPNASGFEYTDPALKSYGLYDDGTKTYCEMIRAAMRWHSESFSFQTTSYAGYELPTRDSWGLPADPVPVGDDLPGDAFALVPIELDWTKYGEGGAQDNVAYHNPTTGVKITHFPVIHTRRGSIGYKLEWKGLTMIYTGDTKPEIRSRDQAINGGDGVDVFIHEMVVPPQVWAMKNSGSTELPDFDSPSVQQLKTVQDSSHTPQGAFGYLLSQISPRPRLTVATHFPVADDTVDSALQSVQAYCPEAKLGENIVWSFDLMQIRVTKTAITQLRAAVSDYGFSPPIETIANQNTPKYWTWAVVENGEYLTDSNGDRIPVGDPYAQIDLSTEIPAYDEDTGKWNYSEDGF